MIENLIDILIIPPKTLLLDHSPEDLYYNFLPQGLCLRNDIEDWCEEHLTQWNIKYISIQTRGELSYTFSMPVIQFEKEDDYLLFMFRWKVK